MIGSDSETTNSLAVSLSGGGHRATLFTLGALMYLVDAKANANVSSIASVSGGSLTNGFVGQTLNFRQAESAEFRDRVAAPLATQIANKGTLFAPRSSRVYVAVLLIFGLAVFIGPLIPWGPGYLRVLSFLIGLALWGWFAGK